MKILSFTAEGVLIPHTLSDIQSALRNAGHEVIVQDIASISGYHAKIVAITDAVVYYNPDIIFTIDQIGIIPQTMALLENPKRIVSWFFDNPLLALNDDSLLLNSKLELFLWDKAYIPELSTKGFSKISYRPFATNPEVFKPIPDPSGKYCFDVSFVGLASEKRKSLIQFLARNGVHVDVFGDKRWLDLQDSNITYHGMASNREACPKIFSNSAINLNITSEQLRTSAPLRIFDVLACGGFLLTDMREDIAQLFKNNKDLVIYNSPEDLLLKIRQYLNQPEARKKTGANGRNSVLATHTFDKVVPEILNETFTSKVCSGNQTGYLSGLSIVQAKRLIALSFLKFGRYDLAYNLLMEIVNVFPDDPDAIFGMAVLADRLEKPKTIEMCINKLISLNSAHAKTVKAMLENSPAGTKTNCWPELYSIVFPDGRINFNPDGTIPGWTDALIH